VSYWALERLVRGPWGRTLRAIREDEAAASALGKNPTAYRLQAFVLGSMLMGLAGGLFASFFGFIAPADFVPIVTFQLWTMLIVGGAGNNLGALIGAYVVWGCGAAAVRCCTSYCPPPPGARRRAADRAARHHSGA